MVKAAALTVLLNLWFLVPFLYFFLKENLYQKALDWSGFSEYSINASFLADTFHTNDYRFLSLGLPVLGCAGICVLKLVCEKSEEKNGKTKQILTAFSPTPVSDGGSFNALTGGVL